MLAINEMNHTPIMHHGNNGRRHSLLELSSGGTVRPRSCSTSMVTVAESSQSLRSGDRPRRPSATPCGTPCFVSPRMAFSTQFSYDSPIQIITSSGEAFKPVAKWTSRLPLASLLCSKKGVLLLFLFTIGVVSFILLTGEGNAWSSEGQCDAHDPTTSCHARHVLSSLQRFLQETSISEPGNENSQQIEDLTEEEPIEYRNVRPRMLTIRGQYERETEENENHSDVNVLEEANPGERENENLHFPHQDGRIRRALGEADKQNLHPNMNPTDEHSMRVITEEALPLTTDNQMESRNGQEFNQEPTEESRIEFKPPEQHIHYKDLERRNFQSPQRNPQIEEQRFRQQLQQQQQPWQGQDQGRQAHHRRERHPPQPQQRRPGVGERWVDNTPSRGFQHPPSPGLPHQGQPGLDNQVWRDHRLNGQRLPRGVNPRRYYMQADL